MPFRIAAGAQTQCLDKCPDSTKYSQDFRCVEKCDSGAYVETGGKYMCVDSCNKFYIVSEAGQQCVDSCEEQNFSAQCIPACSEASPYLETDGTCVKTCQGGYFKTEKN